MPVQLRITWSKTRAAYRQCTYDRGRQWTEVWWQYL